MDIIGDFEKVPLPESRLLTLDTIDIGMRKRYVKALVEFDVTKARETIRKRKAVEGAPPLSFTAWLVKCIAEAASEYPEVHSVLKRRKLYSFKDVDVTVAIETELKGKLVPLPAVLRKTNEKTVKEISAEIKKIKKSGTPEGGLVIGDKETSKAARFSVMLPGFMRRLGMRWYLSNPLRIKKTMGTVVVTSVGMFGMTGGWGIPISIHPLSFAIGGIGTKPVVRETGIEPGEVLSVTILFDHGVVDGADAARFTSRLGELIESAFGLES